MKTGIANNCGFSAGQPAVARFHNGRSDANAKRRSLHYISPQYVHPSSQPTAGQRPPGRFSSWRIRHALSATALGAAAACLAVLDSPP